MKIIKTKLRNKIEDDFLGDYLVIYIDKEVAENFAVGFIIDEFSHMMQHRV